MQINNRQLLVIIGDKEEECQAHAKEVTKNLNALDLVDPKKSNDYLGQEFDAVIFNTFDGFDPNALGAISGTIRAGGFLLILKPREWEKNSLYLSRFQKILNAQFKTYKIFLLIDSSIDKPQILDIPTKNKINQLYASLDQQHAVEAIIKVVKGHRRRPLVITADRGRGKSASLGIASAQLASTGLNNIIVCAPSKKTANIIFESAKRINQTINISFYSPDELQLQKPKANLLLIDEAGAIPLALLESFVMHYSRIVFATTLHGYEGSGRGFALKFFKTLDVLTPDWKHCQLKTPIRYVDNDPLENFIFKSLLLDAEPSKDDLFKNLKLTDCTYQTINKKILVQNEDILHQVFGLLVSAHYQTKPSDLMLLLDDNSLSIHALISPQQNIIAVALSIEEGSLDAELATHIFQGKRRVKGHLVAQALSANVGLEMAPCLRGERISRIAVHPQLQGKGFGSHLLALLFKASKADYLSSSFGASESLIHFWEKSNFIAVYLGIKRDASSGAHSVIMLKGINESGQNIANEAQVRFSKNFLHLLTEPFNALEAEIVFALLKKIQVDNPSHFSELEKHEILAFAKHQRGYENTLYLLWKLTCKTLPSAVDGLDDIDKKILLHKVLQKQPWKKLVKTLDLSGKKEALLILRKSVAKLNDEY